MMVLDRLVRALARLGVVLAAASLLVSMALIGYSVVMRYFLNQPIAWVDELAGYLLVGSVMLAAADALLAEIFTNEGTGTLVVRDTKALSAAEQGASEPGTGA